MTDVDGCETPNASVNHMYYAKWSPESHETGSNFLDLEQAE